MLKRKLIRKIFVATGALFIVVILYTLKLIPNKDKVTNIYYASKNLEGVIYTIDRDYYIGKTSIYVNDDLSVVDKIKSLLEAMTSKSSKSELLSDDFKTILPEGTKVLSLEINNKILKINFSKHLKNISKDLEDKMIEAIVYTVTEFKDILGVEVYVENELLKYLPNSLRKLPSLLTRDYGINKVYNINNLYDVNEVVLYYMKENNNVYYVPVTKYVNDEREKIEIIIDDLASNYIYEENLISYLNSNTRLINYEIGDEEIELYFNKYIFDNNDKMLEEVIYTLKESVFASYKDLSVIKIFVNDMNENKLVKEIRK